MSIFKNTTSPSKVGGDSMWYTMEKGDTSKWWPSMKGGEKAQGRMPANPHGGSKKHKDSKEMY